MSKQSKRRRSKAGSPKSQNSLQQATPPVAGAPRPSREGEPEATKVVKKTVESYYSGPIPTPRMIQAWEEVLPGSADRILKLAEDEATHRREQERTALSYDKGDRDETHRQRRFGQRSAVFLCVLAFIYSAWAMTVGHHVSGVAALIVALTPVIGFFIKGAVTKDEEDTVSEGQGLVTRNGDDTS